LGDGLSRRDLLKRGAIAGVVWATPAVQAVSMVRSRAAAVSGACDLLLEWQVTCPVPTPPRGLFVLFRTTSSGVCDCHDSSGRRGFVVLEATIEAPCGSSPSRQRFQSVASGAWRQDLPIFAEPSPWASWCATFQAVCFEADGTTRSAVSNEIEIRLDFPDAFDTYCT
jgi:hypothetical protein